MLTSAGDLKPGERHLDTLLGAPPVDPRVSVRFSHYVKGPPVIGEQRILRQSADAQTRLVPDVALLRQQVAADDLQECGLTGTVPADHADALARVDPKAGLV